MPSVAQGTHPNCGIHSGLTIHRCASALHRAVPSQAHVAHTTGSKGAVLPTPNARGPLPALDMKLDGDDMSLSPKSHPRIVALNATAAAADTEGQLVCVVCKKIVVDRTGYIMACYVMPVTSCVHPISHSFTYVAPQLFSIIRDSEVCSFLIHTVVNTHACI